MPRKKNNLSGGNKKGLVGEKFTWLLGGAAPQTAANWGMFWKNDTGHTQRLRYVSERHETPGDDAGAVTLQLKRVADATAKASGNNLLQTTIDLKGTADTEVVRDEASGLNTTNPEYLDIAPGQGIAAVPTGTLTALAGVTISIVTEAVD